ncbi:MAG: hypothetical protein JW878_03540 [Methanomicrobia archaeon]|nr:hypothetical protein [Methanomicrobia archaeon]
MIENEEWDFKEFTPAIALLVGISAVLFKITEYFNTNIVNLSNPALISVYLLVSVLISEILIISLFILTKGYMIAAKDEELKVLRRINAILNRWLFVIPIFVIIYSFLSVFYLFVTRNWQGNIIGYFDSYSWLMFFLVSVFISAILFTDIYEKFKLLSFQYSKYLVKKKIRSLGHIFQSPEDLNKSNFAIILTLLFYAFLLILIPFVLIIIPTFLLCGSYSIEIANASYSCTDEMMVTIYDTGVPSSRCYISLYNLTNSNEIFFDNKDDITIEESGKNESHNGFMTGEKRDGIYYLSINTSSLVPNYYLLKSEVTYNDFRNFALLRATKRDHKLFYLAPKNIS